VDGNGLHDRAVTSRGGASSAFDDALGRLREFYGPQPLPPRDPFALYVWEVMNFHAAPLKRDAALAALRRIPALTPDSIWKTPLGKLEAAVTLAGPYLDERIRALRAGADLFRRNPGLVRTLAGPMLPARRALRALPQLGGPGAARMLLFAADFPVIPVDSAVARVVVRLGLCEPTPDVRRQAHRVRRVLDALVTKELDGRRRTVQLLAHHGQSTCAEFDPHCGVCPLATTCPFAATRPS
jgi:endonuclease III